MDNFQKINYRDIIEEGNLISHKKMDIVAEENIIFSDERDQKKFEDALIRIEDQEDAEAFKMAKQEIDDEFQEEGGANTTTAAGS